MRRFRQGATNGPSLPRPGAGYGKLCFGAPGPLQDVDPREELIPEHFSGEVTPGTPAHATDFTRATKEQDAQGNTVIDLTNN